MWINAWMNGWMNGWMSITIYYDIVNTFCSRRVKLWYLLVLGRFCEGLEGVCLTSIGCNVGSCL